MADEKVSTYVAVLEYRGMDRSEFGCAKMDIEFIAPTPSEAILAALRFWQNRRRQLPEWFDTLLCMKIYVHYVGPIADDGMLQTRKSMHFFEYKYDTAGMPLVEYFHMKTEWLNNA